MKNATINNNLDYHSFGSKKENTSIKQKEVCWPKEFTLANDENYLQTFSYKQKPKKQPLFANNTIKKETAQKAAGTAAILRAAHYCIEKLSQCCSQIMLRSSEFASEEEVKKVAQAMKKNNGLEANIYYISQENKNILKNKFPSLAKALDVVADGKNAFYTDLHNLVVAPNSKPSLILHELGHAINFEKSTVFSALQNFRILGMYIPSILAFLNTLDPNKHDNKPNFIEKYAGVIGFVSFLPTILEEGMASLRGIKVAKNQLPNANLKSLKGSYLLAWLTYVLAGISAGIVSKLAITEQKVKQA